jgi:hypothetical protein
VVVEAAFEGGDSGENEAVAVGGEETADDEALAAPRKCLNVAGRGRAIGLRKARDIANVDRA